MRRDQLEHLIRAAAAIADEHELIIVGSAALLASYPLPPDALARTREADLYPPRDPAKADLIDAAIGEGSQFDQTYGYYAHGVGPETAILPAGWEARLVRIQNANTNGEAGLCIEPHDLACAKLAAGRPKDSDFVRALLRYRLIEPATLRERIAALPIATERRQAMLAALGAP